jgi:hypothetical protein
MFHPRSRHIQPADDAASTGTDTRYCLLSNMKAVDDCVRCHAPSGRPATCHAPTGQPASCHATTGRPAIWQAPTGQPATCHAPPGPPPPGDAPPGGPAPGHAPHCPPHHMLRHHWLPRHLSRPHWPPHQQEKGAHGAGGHGREGGKRAPISCHARNKPPLTPLCVRSKDNARS